MSPLRGSGARIFPLPTLPLPFTNSRSRRVQQRYARTRTATIVANRCVSALNSLHVSFAHSSSAFSSSSFASDNLYSGTRQRLLDNIFNLSNDFVRRQAASAPSDDDGVYPPSQFHYHQGSFTPIVPLEADLISLPSDAGTASLLDLLPPHLSAIYNDPQQLLLPTPRPGRQPTPASMGINPLQYIKLIKRMLAVGMISFTHHPKVVNGIFATPKPDGGQRLIINARPCNHLFSDPPPVALPTPDVTAKIVVPPNSKLYIAKVDIDNFYHRLLLPEWMWPYFALPPVSSAAIGLAGPDTLVYPCCRTLPMGWSHSVYVAQAAHEYFLVDKVGLDAKSLLTAGSDSKLDRTRLQLYIDDTVFFGLDRDDVAALQSRYMNALTAVGLPPKLSKVVLPTCEPVECLGLEVDGVKLTIGLSASKLRDLIDLTRLFLMEGECSGAQLSHLVGKWTWAAMACRPSLAVFSAVYTFINRAQFRIFTLWPSVRRELITIMNLAPLLRSSLTDLWCSRVVAVDASTTGMGVVSTPFVSNQPDDYLHPSTRWSVIVSSQWRDNNEHINSLELRAAATAVKWSLSYPSCSPGRKLLLFSDSQVAIGSLSKGRSSSPLLLRRLRAISASLLASGLRLLLYWIPSELNPADEPSRF